MHIIEAALPISFYSSSLLLPRYWLTQKAIQWTVRKQSYKKQNNLDGTRQQRQLNK